MEAEEEEEEQEEGSEEVEGWRGSKDNNLFLEWW